MFRKLTSFLSKAKTAVVAVGIFITSALALVQTAARQWADYKASRAGAA